MIRPSQKRPQEKILISNLHSNLRVPLKGLHIKSLINRVLRKENKKIIQIHINFVSNASLKSINKGYLKHNYTTDIITFDYRHQKNGRIDGEMLISLDAVRENSKIYNSSFKRELSRVIIHGCLHLAGYDDRTRGEKELMRNKENSYLRN